MVTMKVAVGTLNGRKIDDFVSINAFARGSLKDICDELNKVALRSKVVASRPFRTSASPPCPS